MVGVKGLVGMFQTATIPISGKLTHLLEFQMGTLPGTSVQVYRRSKTQKGY